MKKIIFLLLTVIATSCSEDDEIQEVFAEEIEILDHGWSIAETVGEDVKVSLNAEIRNETREDERGRLIFFRYRDNDNPDDSNVILYTEVFDIPKGKTIEYSEVIEDPLISKEVFDGGYNEVEFEKM